MINRGFRFLLPVSARCRRPQRCLDFRFLSTSSSDGSSSREWKATDPRREQVRLHLQKELDKLKEMLGPNLPDKETMQRLLEEYKRKQMAEKRARRPPKSKEKIKYDWEPKKSPAAIRRDLMYARIKEAKRAGRAGRASTKSSHWLGRGSKKSKLQREALKTGSDPSSQESLSIDSTRSSHNFTKEHSQLHDQNSRSAYTREATTVSAWAQKSKSTKRDVTSDYPARGWKENSRSFPRNETASRGWKAKSSFDKSTIGRSGTDYPSGSRTYVTRAHATTRMQKGVPEVPAFAPTVPSKTRNASSNKSVFPPRVLQETDDQITFETAYTHRQLGRRKKKEKKPPKPPRTTPKLLPWQRRLSCPIHELDPLTVEKPFYLCFSKMTENFADPNRFVQWIGGLNDGCGKIYFDRAGDWPRHVWEIIVHERDVSIAYYLKMMMRYSTVRKLPNNLLAWRMYDPKGLLRMARMVQGQCRSPERQAELKQLCAELGHPELYVPPVPLVQAQRHSMWLSGFFEARGRFRVDEKTATAFAEIVWHEPKFLHEIKKNWGYGKVVRAEAPPNAGTVQFYQTGECRRWTEVDANGNAIATDADLLRDPQSSVHLAERAAESLSAEPYVYKLVFDEPSSIGKLQKYLSGHGFKGSLAIDLVRWNRTVLFYDRGYHIGKGTRKGPFKLARLIGNLNTRLPATPASVSLSWDAEGGEATRPDEPQDETGWIQQVDEERWLRTTGRVKPLLGEPGYVPPDPNEPVPAQLTKKQKRALKRQRQREEKKLREMSRERKVLLQYLNRLRQESSPTMRTEEGLGVQSSSDSTNT